MNPRVLLVDDDASVRESIGKVLAESGYAVTTVAKGAEADVPFVNEKIDLVLLDLNLGDGNGWDVFERLTTRYPLVPVIIITGMANQFGTALRAGVGALMEKPVDAPALLQTMRDLLSEPEEARLRRMCGYLDDTRYFQGRRPNQGERANEPGVEPPPMFRAAKRGRSAGSHP